MNVLGIMVAIFAGWMAVAILGTGLAMIYGASAEREMRRLEQLRDDEFRRYIDDKRREAKILQEEEEYAEMERRYFG